ncbi:hypothetical protein R6Z07F_020154 [Ovis aries]
MPTSSLTVAFSSHAEADIARHFLTPRTQLRGPIRKELDVNGRMLVLTLSVSSLSYPDVDVVIRYLTQDADLDPEAVERELVVTGSDLMLLLDKRTREGVVHPSLPVRSPACTRVEASVLVFRAAEGGGEGSRWSPMHMMEEPPGQPKKKPKKPKKTQVPWNLQRAQHMVATECQVVLVARMTLVTQLALVTSSVTGFMEALVTWLVPEAPALQESQVAQLVPFCRSRGHLTLQGLVEMLHLEPQF